MPLPLASSGRPYRISCIGPAGGTANRLTPVVSASALPPVVGPARRHEMRREALSAACKCRRRSFPADETILSPRSPPSFGRLPSRCLFCLPHMHQGKRTAPPLTARYGWFLHFRRSPILARLLDRNLGLTHVLIIIDRRSAKSDWRHGLRVRHAAPCQLSQSRKCLDFPSSQSGKPWSMPSS